MAKSAKLLLILAILLLSTFVVGEEEEDEEETWTCSDNTCSEKQDITVKEIWGKLDCETIFESPRPVHNQSTWMMLRGVYHGIVGQEKSSIAPLSHESGVRVPFKVKRSKVKGRGIYAKELVKKGELVWAAQHQSARFSTGEEYRRFLRAIPVDVACDVIQWAYVQKFAGVAYICADLDEGSFLNTAGFGKETANLGCIQGEDCPERLYALRDIEVGKEFIGEYGDFAITHGWKWFGL